jgi:hypothetical protein
MTSATESTRWLLLVCQLPAQPAYARVKLHRRLQAIGAVAVKKTVYALPATDEALEDFLWTAKEVDAAGGEAFVCEARLVEGVSDAQLRASFAAARDADYHALVEEVAALMPARSSKRGAGTVDAPAARSALTRLRRRLGEIAELDFFAANGRAAAEAALSELEARLMQTEQQPAESTPPSSRTLKELRGKRWVTRRGVHVDRIACAWLIRKFIDPAARFKFVDATGYEPKRDELRFDMADAEYTHRGKQCSFEVLLAEIGQRDPALRAIAEIVHDLDLKDERFGRAETQGVRQVLDGITLATDDDGKRLERGGALFDDLYRSLQRKSARSKPTRGR